MISPYDPDLHSLAGEANDVAFKERITHHIQRIREGQDELRQTMRELASAMSRIALVEERQANTAEALGRLGDTLEKLDARLRVLEVSEPGQAKAADWVEKMVWAAAGFGVMAIISKSGLI